jgi:hypothetical protein
MIRRGTDTDTRACLVEVTLELVRNRPVWMTYYKLGELTGVSSRWLVDFATGRIKEPSCQRVQRIYECLADKALIEQS